MVHAHFTGDRLHTAWMYDTVTGEVFCDDDQVLGVSFENDPDLFMANMRSVTMEDETVNFYDDDGNNLFPYTDIAHMCADMTNRFWEGDLK